MRALAVAALVLLAGCQKSFDDRYADAQKKLNEQAVSIDRELAAKASDAAMGDPVAASGVPTEMPQPARGPVAGPR
ncbi:MAG TPA: hypothetical protein VF481_15980 [Novosphingobium sp.]